MRTFHNTLLATLLFIATLFLFTRENRFPFFYHPDESSKVEQLQTSQWNFHHPMLLLSSAKGAITLLGEKEDAQRVGEVGRFTSAFFCAGGALCLALVVGLLAGRFAAMAAGLLLLTNHQLFELAHYLKEDTALFFGISAWFLALGLYWKRPSAATAALVGAGAAFALSGKYIGAFAPIASLILLPLRVTQGARLKMLGSYLLALSALFALINLPLILQYGEFRESLDREVNLAVKGHRGLTRSVPHDVYFTAFRDNIFYALWLPIAWFYVVRCWRERRKLTAFEWTFTLFPIAYLLVLSFIPKTNDRYFLPATGLFLCAAALGISMIARHIGSRRLKALLVASAVLTQLPNLAHYYSAFRKDDLKDLTTWLNTELPDATLAVDRRVMLPSPRRASFLPYQTPLKATVVHQTVEKFPSLEAMHAAGVTHVVLSETTYGRYFSTKHRPQAKAKDEFNQRHNLYVQLKESAAPLWGEDRQRGTVIYLHPGLQVYALPSLPAKTPATPPPAQSTATSLGNSNSNNIAPDEDDD